VSVLPRGAMHWHAYQLGLWAHGLRRALAISLTVERSNL
jgi:hypothetical protein